MNNPSIFIIVIVFAIAVAAMIYFLTMSRHVDTLTRLEKHKKKLAERMPAAEDDIIFVEQRDDYLAKLLVLAGMESKYDSMKTQWICSTLGIGVLFMLLAWRFAPELLILGCVLGFPIGGAAYAIYINWLAKKRQDKLTEQLPQVLEVMVSSLKAGSPILETFKTLSETAPEPIRGEFKRAMVSLQLGKTLRESLKEMTTRIKASDFKLLTQAVFISQEVGANLSDVVATIALAIRERFKLRNFINSLTSQGKMTALFIGFLPYLIMFMVTAMAPDYMMPFFDHPVARIILIGLICWEMLGAWILIKMTTFEVS